MNKATLYQKAKARANKTVVTSFIVIFIFLFFGVFAMANTYISNSGTSTFGSNINMNSNNITVGDMNVTSGLNVGGNSVFNGNVTAGNVNITGNMTILQNIYLQQNQKLCFDGSACNVYMYYNGTSLITKVN